IFFSISRFLVSAGPSLSGPDFGAIAIWALSALTTSALAFVNSGKSAASLSKAGLALRSSSLSPSNSGFERIQRILPVFLSRQTRSDTSVVRKILSPTMIGQETPVSGSGVIQTIPLVTYPVPLLVRLQAVGGVAPG